MAERPVFVATTHGSALVEAVSIAFVWHGGFAESQKKKNVAGLHAPDGTSRMLSGVAVVAATIIVATYIALSPEGVWR